MACSTRAKKITFFPSGRERELRPFNHARRHSRKPFVSSAPDTPALETTPVRARVLLFRRRNSSRPRVCLGRRLFKIVRGIRAIRPTAFYLTYDLYVQANDTAKSPPCAAKFKYLRGDIATERRTRRVARVRG